MQPTFRLVCLAVAALVGAGPARAQQTGTVPRGVGPLLRIEAGALNPGALDAATMSFGVAAGIALGERAILLARVLRQSQNSNHGADLTRDARDLYSLLVEWTSGAAVRRHRQYHIRFGAGVMRRGRLPDAPVATLGLGVRYPIYRSLTLIASFEDDIADLPAGSYEYDYYESAYLGLVHVTVTARHEGQSNFGFLLAVEWRPRR